MMSAQVCFPFKGLALQLFWESIRCPSECGHLASNRCAIASTKLKCQTFEWKTDLCRHHVDQPPPLMLQTVPVHYHCVLPCKLSVSFDQSGTSGAHVFMVPLCGKLSSVQSAPSIPLLISLQKCEHYCILCTTEQKNRLDTNVVHPSFICLENGPSP